MLKTLRKESAEFLSRGFQLVVISARVLSVYAEANRCCRVLPVDLCRTLILLHYAFRSLVEIMDSSLSAGVIHEDFLLHILKQTVVTMVTIETQLLPRKVRRFLKAKVVKEEQTRMKELELKVQTATNTSKTSVRSEKVHA